MVALSLEGNTAVPRSSHWPVLVSKALVVAAASVAFLTPAQQTLEGGNRKEFHGGPLM